MPCLTRLAFEGDFLADRVDALLLFKGIGVAWREVLVHVHTVVQVLESGHGIEDEVICLMLDIETCVQEATTIGAFAVVGDLIFFIIIRITPFVGIVIVHVEIEFPVIRSKPNGTDASASGLHIIYLLVEERVGEESVRTFVISTGRECKTFADTVIVSEGCATMIVSRAITQLHVCTLVRERRTGMYLYEATHGVSSVKCSLWTTEDVDTFDVIEIEIESRLV